MAHPSGLSLIEQLDKAYRAAKKAGDFESMVYYSEKASNPNLAACASFDRFKGTQAYHSWVNREGTKAAIESHRKEAKRLSWS